ncbi:MAG TPA: DUF2069 domain-containing protein [Burkholderiales bacterium]|nr:DUF2069 domain-containing protein [Burkholderiales bacterium]
MNAASAGTGLRVAASALLAALIVVTLAWELWLAPLRPGGSWLALKTLPLLLPLRGIFAGRRYTYQWAMMLVLAYVAEGCVRAYAEAPPVSTLALIEIALATAFFLTAITYIRTNRRRPAQ